MFFDNMFLDGFLFGPGNKNDANAFKLSKRWAGLNTFYNMLSIVGGRFDYENLPDYIDDRFTELCFLCKNATAIAPNSFGEPQSYMVGYGNRYQEFGYYNNVQVMDYMGKSHGMFIPDFKGNVAPDCVVVFNSKFNVPPIYRIKWYADQLTLIQGSINACIANLKGSVLIKCTKEQEPAVKRAWKNADDGTPVIISFAPNEGGMDIDPEVICNAQTGDVLKTLIETRDKYLADFLTEFGINANGVINKMSGVSGMELMQNDQMRQINLNNALEIRQEGFDKVNKMFGTNIQVKLNEALEPVDLGNLEQYSNKNTIINSNNDSRQYE